MIIDDLIKILTLPNSIYHNGNKNEWEIVENKIGIQLPFEYKQFIETYGAGGIDNFLWFLNPFINEENIGLFIKYPIINNSYLISKQKSPDLFQHVVYPEKGGLFPFSYTDNGDTLFFLTEGEPDNWPIIIYDARSPDYFQYTNSFIQFFYQLIIGQLKCSIFPNDFPNNPSQFIGVRIDN